MYVCMYVCMYVYICYSRLYRGIYIYIYIYIDYRGLYTVYGLVFLGLVSKSVYVAEYHLGY